MRKSMVKFQNEVQRLFELGDEFGRDDSVERQAAVYEKQPDVGMR